MQRWCGWASLTCRANSAPSGDTMLIWVEPWMGRPGATRRISSTTPMSCAGRGGQDLEMASTTDPFLNFNPKQCRPLASPDAA